MVTASPLASTSKCAASSAASASRSTGSAASTPLDASSRLESSISPMSASSSAMLRAISALALGSVPGTRSIPRRMRASGVRNSCEQLASSIWCARTSFSMCSADSLKLFASAATSSRPSTLTRAARLPAPNCWTPVCSRAEARGDAAREGIGQQREHRRDAREQEPRVQAVQQESMPRMHDQVAAVGEPPVEGRARRASSASRYPRLAPASTLARAPPMFSDHASPARRTAPRPSSPDRPATRSSRARRRHRACLHRACVHARPVALSMPPMARRGGAK